jgi:hypothetical protein
VAVGVFFLAAAIIPAFNFAIVDPATHGTNIQNFAGIVWLPVLDPATNPAIFANPFLNPFRLLLTVDILMMICPMLYEIKITEARIPVWPVILLAIVFALDIDPGLFARDRVACWRALFHGLVIIYQRSWKVTRYQAKCLSFFQPCYFHSTSPRPASLGTMPRSLQ